MARMALYAQSNLVSLLACLSAASFSCCLAAARIRCTNSGDGGTLSSWPIFARLAKCVEVMLLPNQEDLWLDQDLQQEA